MKTVTVRFGRIDIHNDNDNWGSGELFFIGRIISSPGDNADDTGLSDQVNKNSGEGWDDSRSVSVIVPDDGRVTVLYEGYDDDTTTQETLGSISDEYAGPEFGVGGHAQLSSNRKMTVSYYISVTDVLS
ncbi:hypothetical protein [Thiothrix winogradskyi]|uniref:Uncharacterized protein n=1 Tax=Thiothrix winogradskyi TaxID=96472 RepID=A0ABY3T0F7_9GAMM|nr:hypothetical protein [Thiothrix winogradskyi]UJS25277.1 hypothetical protein L2Y54_04350 [Thiothrix winogradskyi]